MKKSIFGLEKISYSVMAIFFLNTASIHASAILLEKESDLESVGRAFSRFYKENIGVLEMMESLNYEPEHCKVHLCRLVQNAQDINQKNNVTLKIISYYNEENRNIIADFMKTNNFIQKNPIIIKSFFRDKHLFLKEFILGYNFMGKVLKMLSFMNAENNGQN